MKARLAAGETLFGTFLTLGSPLAAESLALAGFDWLLVDLEHGGGDESLLLGQLLGATAGGAHALVRVESDVRGRTARALDLGVEGVMCPQVNSAEAAAAWASAMHYGTRPRDRAVPPRRAVRDRPGRARERARAGLRDRADRVAGGGRGRRADRGRRRDRRAVRRSVSDLSFSMGKFRQFDDPEFRSAIERVVAAARDTGKTAGIFLTSPDQVPSALADGFRMIALGSDGGFMMKAAREEIELSRRASRRAERGAHRVGAQVAQRPQEAARGRQGRRGPRRASTRPRRASRRSASAHAARRSAATGA